MALIVKNEASGAVVPSSTIRMPMSSVWYANTYIKTSKALTYNSTTATFWSFFGVDAEPSNRYGSQNTTTWAAGEERTLIDTTGFSGILTHALSPQINVDGVVSVTIIADGVSHVFSKNVLSGNCLLVGQFNQSDVRPSTASGTGNYEIGVDRYRDNGWETISNTYISLMSPTDAHSLTGVGIPFKDSLIVKIYMGQVSNNTTYRNYSGVAYTKTGVQS